MEWKLNFRFIQQASNKDFGDFIAVWNTRGGERMLCAKRLYCIVLYAECDTKREEPNWFGHGLYLLHHKIEINIRIC